MESKFRFVAAAFLVCGNVVEAFGQGGRLEISQTFNHSVRGSLPPSAPSLARLNIMFDAAAVRPAAIFAPTGAAMSPVPGRIPRAAQKQKTAKEGPLVITVPATPAQYRRTFKLLMSNPEKTDKYDELIVREARAKGLDPRLVKAVIAAESEFSRLAVSPADARGLMQVMPRTSEEMGIPGPRLFDPEDNIRAGTSYLEWLFKVAWKKFKLKGLRFHDAPLWIIQRVIAAYNAGPRFITSRGWYKETRNYVRKVVLFYRSPVTDVRRQSMGSFRLPEFTPQAGLLY